ncbi:solute carrier family 2, facilitated glucose transporter member 8-like [Dermacentor variabilis]|uniref:solute carrier family 2, facilitated glucose transporter member 8-like n=1 Tax=Dermacentor variabilis TaxID=34621 RepID=UPI003F5B9CE4
MHLIIGSQQPESLDSTITPAFAATLLSAWLGSFCMGVALGYTSPATGSLAATTAEHADSFRHLASSIWLTSLLPLGAIPGSVAGTILCQAMGRRFTLLVSALAYMTGYSVIFAANSGLFVLAGRFLTGVATGIVSLCVPAYVSEVALPRHRGTLGGVVQLSIAAGVLYSYVLGTFLEWELLALACFAVAILLVAASQFSVESPRWLLLNGRKIDALQALMKLRGMGGRVDNECQAIDHLFAVLPTPVSNVLLAVHVYLLQQFSGITMVILHAHTMLSAPGFAVSASTTSIIIASLQTVQYLHVVAAPPCDITDAIDDLPAGTPSGTAYDDVKRMVLQCL